MVKLSGLVILSPHCYGDGPSKRSWNLFSVCIDQGKVTLGQKGTNTQFRQTKYQDTNQETDIIVVVVVLEKIIKIKLKILNPLTVDVIN